MFGSVAVPVLCINNGRNGSLLGNVPMIQERFVQTRKAVIELAIVQAQLSEMGDDWKPETVKGNGIADPTASRAVYEIDVLEDLLEQLKEREQELIDFIGTTLAVIEGVRNGLGNDYAEILDQRYIDGLKWEDLEIDGKPIPKTTAWRKQSIAFDWIDSVGLTGILKGDYEI